MSASKRTLTLTGVATVVLCSIIVLPLVFVKKLPEPTGPFSVGTTLVDLSDSTSSDATLLAQIWYPAMLAGNDVLAPYHFRNANLPLRDRFLGSLVRTSASIDALPLPGRHTIVLYVPGLGGRRSDNSSQAQEFASHGYIVVALDDTRPKMTVDFASPLGLQATYADGNRKVERQAIDVRMALDSLQRLDGTVGNRFYEHFEMNRVVMFGFSFGGSVAAEVAAVDLRVAGAIDLDGSMFGTVLANGFSKPFLMMTGTGGPPGDDAAFDRVNNEQLVRALNASGGCVIEVAGAQHYNFSDASVLPSLRRTGRGPIDARRGNRLVSTYVLAFLDEISHGVASPLLHLKNRGEPEIRFRVYPSASVR